MKCGSRAWGKWVLKVQLFRQCLKLYTLCPFAISYVFSVNYILVFLGVDFLIDTSDISQSNGQRKYANLC